MSTLPIGDYALLSDCNSAALVNRWGSVDWLCFPRFDSPSVFGRLLDERAGHWSIRPAGDFKASRRYRDRTMLLETTFQTPAGEVLLTDGLALGHKERGHDLGLASPHTLLRSVECVQGEVTLEMEWVPRPEYGLVLPALREVNGGMVGRGGGACLVLSSPVPLRRGGSEATATFTLRAGGTAAFALQHHVHVVTELTPWTQREIARRLEDTSKGWRGWSDMHQRYKGPWEELVHLSGRVLRALTFQPSGAVVAAVTTSLPEGAGGSRNWDYRYTWVRDASLTLDALWVAACPDEAYRFLDFLAEAAEGQLAGGRDLQIMFGIGGEHDLSEREIPHLRGWRQSLPVRVGNDAWKQRQIDVYGELLAAVHRLADKLRDLDPSTRRFLVNAAEMAAVRWNETDQGIWEVRGEPRHFLYSKLMCWVALDRAIQLADLLEAQDRVERWKAIREEIREAILTRGWSEQAQAFTQSFGSDALDASNLMMPIVGFLPATDPRMRATIDATAEHLTDRHGLVYRYRAADGLEGEEGTFLLCTFWLAQAQALAGELDAARATFERAAAFVNDVGLLAEEVDPETRELLGNFPQAFSHIGLVNAAWVISQAELRPQAPMEAPEEVMAPM
ncbi:MAG: glycoside hydrolase family 15 protein [Myxococcaceae bacterium]|nr:glycoside hydrolase family 15 protein [Myxococcaceae bacterium]